MTGVSTLTDSDGYVESECPNCGYFFKINASDLANTVKDYGAYCPRCGVVSASEHWQSVKRRLLGSEGIDEDVVGLVGFDGDRTDTSDLYGNPEALLCLYNGREDKIEGQVVCSCCGTGMKTVGCSFICPCCGYNNVLQSYRRTLQTLYGTVSSAHEVVGESTFVAGASVTERQIYASAISEAYRGFEDYVNEIYCLINMSAPSKTAFSTPSKTVRVFERICAYPLIERNRLEALDGLVSKYVKGHKREASAPKEDAVMLLTILMKLSDGISKIK